MMRVSLPSKSGGGAAGAGMWGRQAASGPPTFESPGAISNIEKHPGRPNTEQSVVLLCSDVSEQGPNPVPAGSIAAGLRRHSPQVQVFVVENLCSGPTTASAALKTLGARRLAIGCRQGATRREEIVACLRRAGIHPSGIQLVDLMPFEQSDPVVVAAQSIIRIRAALTQLAWADLDAPVRERLALGSVEVSRRSLFRPSNAARRPVASFIEARCDGGEHCRACVEACPHGALRVTGTRMLVDEAACTGCGACLSACRSAAISLNGTSISELQEAASVLVAEARLLGSGSLVGLAIVCTKALAKVPLGGSWLPLEVPSLEMVSAGWPLQILSADVGVKLVGCDDVACATRARELTDFCSGVVNHVDPSWRQLIGAPGCLRSTAVSRSRETPPAPVASIEFREPEATVGALSALVSRGSDPAAWTSDAPTVFISRPTAARGAPWRIESSVASLGEITIDAGGCSACGCCTLACPTGALQASRQGAAMAFSFEALTCSACGACVSSCPEAVVSLRRVVDPVLLTAGRRSIAEVVAGPRCVSCGQPLAHGLAGRVVGRRLAASHPEIAARLEDESRCTDCLLEGRRGHH